MKSEELNFVFSLSTKEFLQAASRVQSEYERTRKRVERPMHMRAKIDGVINSFARLGLALDGIQRMYRLILNPAKEFIELSNKQEQAEQGVISALKTLNEYSDQNFKLLKQQASAIQAVTTVGDEQVLMLQKLALNMGVSFNKIDEVIKGTIGLSTSFKDAGLSQEQALKGIANALQGNFTQLQRYIPALRSLKDDTEKMAYLQKLMADGFRQAKDEAQTGAGQLQQFSNIVGDLKEVGGDLLKNFLVPMAQILRPILVSLQGMDSGVRNASVATIAFLAVGMRIPAMLSAIRASIISLNASIGPAGWLILGLSATAIAFETYTNSIEDANTETEKFVSITDKAVERINKIFKISGAGGISIELEKINKRIEYFNKKYEENRKKLKEIENQLKDSNLAQQKISELNKEKNAIQSLIDKNQEALTYYIAQKDKILELLGERRKAHAEAVTGMSEKEMQELDKIRQYQFQTHRISLKEYIEYLNSRTEAVKIQFGAESLEYMRHVDRIKQLQQQLISAEQSKIQPILITEKRITRIKRTEAQKQLNIIRTTTQQAEQFQLQYADKIQEFSGRVADMLAYAFVQQFERGIPAMEEFLKMFIRMIEQIAAEIVARAAIFGLLNAIIPGGGSILGGFTKFVFGFQEGGKITRDSVVYSQAVPPGEDGLVAVQTGEYIVNRYATKKYLPLLEMINQQKFEIPRFQSGGQVGAVPKTEKYISTIDIQPLILKLDQLKTAIEQNKPIIYAEMDGIRFLRKYFGEYQNLEIRRSFEK